jgi:hypothetical protein
MTKERFYQIFYDYKKRECTTRDLKELLEAYIYDRSGKSISINSLSMIHQSEITNSMLQYAFDYYHEKYSE